MGAGDPAVSRPCCLRVCRWPPEGPTSRPASSAHSHTHDSFMMFPETDQAEVLLVMLAERVIRVPRGLAVVGVAGWEPTTGLGECAMRPRDWLLRLVGVEVLKVPRWMACTEAPPERAPLRLLFEVLWLEGRWDCEPAGVPLRDRVPLGVGAREPGVLGPLTMPGCMPTTGFTGRGFLVKPALAALAAERGVPDPTLCTLGDLDRLRVGLSVHVSPMWPLLWLVARGGCSLPREGEAGDRGQDFLGVRRVA